MAHVTIPAAGPYISYTGDGTTVAFTFPFPFFDASDITVYLDGVAQSGGYSVSGDALDGGFADGAVTFDAAPGVGAVVILIRALDVERLTDFPYPSQTLDIQSLNTELDRIIAMMQGLALDSRRALRVPAAEITVDEVPGIATRANKVLGFDAEGQPVAMSLGEAGDISTALVESIVNNALAQLFPVGLICVWSGSTSNIPSGWALCNGSAGTPDLRNRFVIGAGSTYSPNATGGATSATSSAGGAHNHGGSTGSHTLTVAEIPVHRHGMGSTFVRNSGSGGTITGSGAYSDGASETQDQGGGSGHAHTIPTQTDHTHTVATMPPYYALCYIMRIGAYTGGGGEYIVKPEVLQFAVSDETTEITTGAAKITLRMPYAMTLQEVRASLGTASTSGAVTIDINQGGATILSTKLTIDQDEKTSTTAAAPAVISTSALTDDAEITIDIDGAGTDAAGLKIALIGVRA